jgi:hypothetical protein
MEQLGYLRTAVNFFFGGGGGEEFLKKFVDQIQVWLKSDENKTLCMNTCLVFNI